MAAVYRIWNLAHAGLMHILYISSILQQPVC